MSVSITATIEKNRPASNVAFLALLEIDVINPTSFVHEQTFYLVHNNEDITYNGHVYIAFPFEMDLKYEQGGIPSITLSLDAKEDQVRTISRSYDGGVGFNVRLMVVASNNLTAPPEVTEYFKVISASSSDYRITWELGAESALRIDFPRRKQYRDRCSWRYKGAECGYTGSMASCDLTLKGQNGCEAHDNALRFGGFPGINNATGRYL